MLTAYISSYGCMEGCVRAASQLLLNKNTAHSYFSAIKGPLALFELLRVT